MVRGEPGAALHEWPAGEIVSVDLQEIEGAVDDRIHGDLLVGRARLPRGAAEGG